MLVKGHHNPTIYTLENTDPNKYFQLQHYKTLQCSNDLNSHSFYFERNQNRDDTAFENCSCLATWYICLDIKIKKIRKKIRILLVNVKL